MQTPRRDGGMPARWDRGPVVELQNETAQLRAGVDGLKRELERLRGLVNAAEGRVRVAENRGRIRLVEDDG